MLRSLILFVSLFSSVGLLAAYDGMLDISSCPTTVITVDNVENAWGWGGHFSTQSNNDGYGGYYAECHLSSNPKDTTENAIVTVLCYDGYLSTDVHVDQYRFDLGPRLQIKRVQFILGEGNVTVQAISHSTSAYTTDENIYTKTAAFSFRKASGFCRQSTLYYSANGVLSGHPNRIGGGYRVSATTIP